METWCCTRLHMRTREAGRSKGQPAMLPTSSSSRPVGRTKIPSSGKPWTGRVATVRGVPMRRSITGTRLSGVALTTADSIRDLLMRRRGGGIMVSRATSEYRLRPIARAAAVLSRLRSDDATVPSRELWQDVELTVGGRHSTQTSAHPGVPRHRLSSRCRTRNTVSGTAEKSLQAVHAGSSLAAVA